MGERLNFYGSLLALTGCVLFILVYSTMPFLTGRRRWWQDRVGRLLVTKAASLAGLMLIVVVYYATDVDAEWIRSVRGLLAGVVGIMMLYQSWLVFRLQREKEGDDQT